MEFATKWIEEVVQEYKREKIENQTPPQLAVASWIAAGFCTQIMFNLCANRPVKVFPMFYLASILMIISVKAIYRWWQRLLFRLYV